MSALSRPDWDTYFLDIALAVSARGDCSRAQHGCILVKDRRIISGGYNGSPSGDPRSCLAGDCPNANRERVGGDYQECIALHAEQNAVAFANRLESIGSTAYLAGRGKPGRTGSLHQPCSMCAKVLQAAGVSLVVCRADNGEVTRFGGPMNPPGAPRARCDHMLWGVGGVSRCTRLEGHPEVHRSESGEDFA